MGLRAARSLDWAARACRVALLASAAVVAVGVATDFGFNVAPEVAIERGLAAVAPSDRLEARARAALDAEDIALARGFADLGAEIGRPLSSETLARLAAAEEVGATAWRNVKSAATGFATGQIDGSAALVGAVAADLTLVGDIRDLAVEGLKAARGEEHSELILGLAAAGVAVTAATYASAGGGAPARFGVSALKAARRTGTMTAEFAADLGRRLVRPAEGAAALGRRAPGAVDGAAGRTATRAVSESGLKALAGATGELRAVGAAVGAGETVRLMKYVRSVDELPELRSFAMRFGAKSRAVAELTGRASLRAFKTTIRLGEMILRHLWAAIVWFGGLLLGGVSNLAWRGLRFAVARV